MRATLPASLVILAALAVPSMVAAQDVAQDGADARYAVATDWANLVMVENDYEAAAARAHPMVSAQLTPAMLEGAMAQLGPQLGSLNGLTPKSQAMEQGFHQVVLSGAFANGTFDVLVILGEDNRVAGFFVRPPSR